MMTNGIILTSISFFHAGPLYTIFFNICLGLFIGGIIFSGISFFLAEIQSNISGEGEIDFDADTDLDIGMDTEIDIDTDIDADVDIDTEIDTEVEFDTEIETDMEIDGDTDFDTDLDSAIIEIAHAPVMILLSATLLVYGISGIILYYVISGEMRFITFFATPIIVYFSCIILNNVWKRFSKSRYYSIASTKNLIGKQGEVILYVDDRGGVIKVPSHTPMKFERVHVKPLNPGSKFEKGEIVYICSVKNGFLLVDIKKNLINRKGG